MGTCGHIPSGRLHNGTVFKGEDGADVANQGHLQGRFEGEGGPNRVSLVNNDGAFIGGGRQGS